MNIRFVQSSDLEQIHALEQINFSPQEQISEEVLATYVQLLPQTCLVMENEGEIAGFILACPSEQSTVMDDLFYLTASSLPQGPHLAIVSLSIAPQYKGQGIGTLLLAALKELAVAGKYQGIGLTCKDHLLNYYEMNQFEDCGPSQSQFGGQVWYDMYWKAL